MSKQEELKIERFTFALLVTMVANQSLDDFLKDKSDEDRAYYGQVLDHQKAVPIGILFNRPNFEKK
jgi:hypothetical protein